MKKICVLVLEAAALLLPLAAYLANKTGNGQTEPADASVQAAEDSGEAQRLELEDADAYFRRGIGYYNAGDYDRAIADYTQAIRLDPNYAMAYGNRGMVYNAKGQKDLAIRDLEKQLSLGVNTEWVQARLKEIRGW